MSVPVRIGNCSGFYGDRIAAAREMVEGGPIDVLCGDYLAELTMLILAKAQAKDPSGGYARTFLTQMEQVLGTCLDHGIKVVANAGGLNPAGLAAALRELSARLGLTARSLTSRATTYVATSTQSRRPSATSNRYRPTRTSAPGASPRRCVRAPTSS